MEDAQTTAINNNNHVSPTVATSPGHNSSKVAEAISPGARDRLRSMRRSGSASSLVIASRRGSIVVSPTNGDLKSPPHPPPQKAHVKFHTQNGGPPRPPLSSTGSNSSSSSSDEEVEAFPRPPDGGWGWVVVVASFLVNLIADGITFSFGVIFVEFLEYFGEGKSKTAWIGSLFMAMPLLSGPVASFLTDRYGCRKCCIVGGILAAAGFIISSFTNSMELLFFTFGILSGFGLSLCYVAAVVIVAYYFEAKRSFATGLSVCGSGIGTFIFAPLTHFLLSEYGWRGTTLVLAGLFLNLCVCGMLMRDLEWTKAKRKKRKPRGGALTASSGDSYSAHSVPPHTPTSCPSVDELKRLLQKPGRNVSDAEMVKGCRRSLEESDLDGVERLCSSLVNLPTFVRNGEKVPLEVLDMLAAHKNLYHVLLQNYPNLLISSNQTSFVQNADSVSSRTVSAKFLGSTRGRQVLDEDDQHCTSRGRSPTDDPQWWGGVGNHNTNHNHSIHPQTAQTVTSTTNRRIPTAAYLKDFRVHRHSLTYRGAMLNINKCRLRASSCPDIYRNLMTTTKEKVEWYSGIWDLWYLLANMLDLSHFANVRFLLFALSNFLLYTWYDVPYVYLTDNAIEMGYSETDGSILISVIGILNMIGEIVLGWAGDRAWVNASLVYALSMALCGAVVAVVPLLTTSYRALCWASGAFGLFIAANYSLTSIILVELITLERFTNAYGLLLLVQGVANLIGPPLAGWLYDITGKYDLPFYLAGIFIALSGILLVVLPCVERVKKIGAKEPPAVPPDGQTNTV